MRKYKEERRDQSKDKKERKRERRKKKFTKNENSLFIVFNHYWYMYQLMHPIAMLALLIFDRTFIQMSKGMVVLVFSPK